VVFILDQERYCKNDSIDVIERQHLEEEDSNEETKGLGAELEGEKASQSDIKGVTSCSPLDPLFVQENNQQKEENMNFMEEEDIQDDPN